MAAITLHVMINVISGCWPRNSCFWPDVLWAGR